MEVDEITTALKEIKCEQNVLKNPDGSADYWEGDTNVLVAVYGPADCRESRQLIDRCYIDVSFRPKDGIPGVAEKFVEHTIRNICESTILLHLHPRCQIVIVVQIMQDRGSLLSCAINAVSMALQDAGISMNCVPAAVTMCIKSQGEQNADSGQREVAISPNREEEVASDALILFVIDSVEKNVICTNCQGALDPSTYRRCLSAAKDASETLFNFYRDSVAKKLSANIRYTSEMIEGHEIKVEAS